MRDKVLRFCREQELFPPGSTVVCAVSGGADSMALLRCMLSLQETLSISVRAAHFNHLLRGAESDADEAFVRDFCGEAGVPLTVGRGDAAAEAACRRCSLETAARALRYDFLLRQEGIIATAHTADDNAETVLLNLVRGTGLRGLAGIPVRRGRIVRPLLSVTREEILSYLDGTAWREDGSNALDGCRRNRIRHHVMPLLREENPAFSETVLRAGLILREEDALLDAEAKAALERARRDGGYDCAALRALPGALLRRAILCLLREQNAADAFHVDSVLRLLCSKEPSGRTGLPHGLAAVKAGGLLRIERPQVLPPLGEYVLSIPGEVLLPELSLLASCFVLKKHGDFSEFSDTILLNYDMIGSEITIRSRRTGDTLALPGGSRTLKRLMIDRRIPAERRARIPVLSVNGAVAAVRGLGVSRDFVPRDGRPVLAVRFQTI